MTLWKILQANPYASKQYSTIQEWRRVELSGVVSSEYGSQLYRNNIHYKIELSSHILSSESPTYKFTFTHVWYKLFLFIGEKLNMHKNLAIYLLA